MLAELICTGVPSPLRVRVKVTAPEIAVAAMRAIPVLRKNPMSGPACEVARVMVFLVNPAMAPLQDVEQIEPNDDRNGDAN